MASDSISRRKWIEKTSLLLASATLLSTLPVDGASSNIWPQTNQPIKLSSNENPYGPSPVALQAITHHTSLGNRYPFNAADELQSSVADHCGFNKSEVILGAGSSQLLQLLGQWAMFKNLAITYVSPTFEILPNMVKRLGGKVNKIPLGQDFNYDLEQIDEVAKKKPGIVYLANPNNPTGIKTPKNDLREFCRTVTRHSYLIVDEAYIEYADKNDSLIDEVKNNDKVIILRTFSKIYGLAGLRIGYLIAQDQLIKELNDHRIWSNDSLSIVGIVAAQASLEDTKYIQSSKAKNNQVRQKTVMALGSIGITPFLSATNFVFFKSPRSEDLKSLLLKQNVNIGQLEYNKEKYARVTIGTDAEMENFINHLTNIYN